MTPIGGLLAAGILFLAAPAAEPTPTPRTVSGSVTLAGGSLTNLGSIHLRRLGLLLVALALRVATEWALNAGMGIVDTLRLPLFAASFGLLLYALWANRGYPGMSLAFVGILSNAVVILVNGGYMPIWEPALVAAGMTPADVTSALHYVLPPPLDANFLIHLGPLADVIPIPLPIIENVASVGDMILTFGLAFFLFAGVVRVPQELDEEQLAAVRERLAAAGAPTRPRHARRRGRRRPRRTPCSQTRTARAPPPR